MDIDRKKRVASRELCVHLVLSIFAGSPGLGRRWQSLNGRFGPLDSVTFFPHLTPEPVSHHPQPWNSVPVRHPVTIIISRYVLNTFYTIQAVLGSLRALLCTEVWIPGMGSSPPRASTPRSSPCSLPTPPQVTAQKALAQGNPPSFLCGLSVLAVIPGAAFYLPE